MTIQKLWNFLRGKIEKEEFSTERMLLEMQYRDEVTSSDGCALHFQTFSTCLFLPDYRHPHTILNIMKPMIPRGSYVI